MIYLRNRYYDPTTAQFLTRDPLDAVTRSAFGYVGGNPLNGSDPTGLGCSIFDPGGCVSDAVSAVGHGINAALPVIHTIANVFAAGASLCAAVGAETVVLGVGCSAIALGAGGVALGTGAVLRAEGRESNAGLALDAVGFGLSGIGSLVEAGAAAAGEAGVARQALADARWADAVDGPIWKAPWNAVVSGWNEGLAGLWASTGSGLTDVSRLLAAGSFGLGAYATACNP